MTYLYTITKTSKRLSDIPEGATILERDGVAVVGRCETCNCVITDGMEYGRLADDVITCKRHSPEPEDLVNIEEPGDA